MAVRIRDICVGGGASPKVIGVLNLSPESFFFGSFAPCDQVVSRVEKMIGEGADVIDLGARSTALDAPPLTVADERERVLAAMKELDGYDAILSLDTMHPEVLDAVLHYDLAAINDINGLGNPIYAKIAADTGLPVIAMAAHKHPGDPLDLTQTHAAMREICSRAEQYGICDLILDPGVGKWIADRPSEADWDLCRQFSDLQQYGCPLLAAVSRKTFIGDAIGKPVHERLCGTLGVLFYLLQNGADIIRVHDVAASIDVVRVFEKLYR
ncbi:MAG: dihydropteroate synthase [Methanocalculaceae archaeon]|nr:dihydropteroate synthase [Methanocalculaceae archaeon]